jgi:hypothetical protein
VPSVKSRKKSMMPSPPMSTRAIHRTLKKSRANVHQSALIPRMRLRGNSHFRQGLTDCLAAWSLQVRVRREGMEARGWEVGHDDRIRPNTSPRAAMNGTRKGAQSGPAM